MQSDIEVVNADVNKPSPGHQRHALPDLVLDPHVESARVVWREGLRQRVHAVAHKIDHLAVVRFVVRVSVYFAMTEFRRS